MNNRIFAIFTVGIFLLFIAGGAYLVTLDQDYRYYSVGEIEKGTNGATLYQTLSPEKQENVDRAIEGEELVIEDASAVPPTLVKKEDEYYRFERERFTNAGAGGELGAALATLLGLALILESFRQEYFTRRAPMPWDGWLG